MMIFLDTGCCGVGLGSFGRIVELRFDETKDGNELSLLVELEIIINASVHCTIRCKSKCFVDHRHSQ